MKHLTKIANSPRLSATLDILKCFDKVTSLQGQNILRDTYGMVTVSFPDCVRDVRRNGIDIECKFSHTTNTGSRIYTYEYKGKK
jgi:hypothetical protein